MESCKKDKFFEASAVATILEEVRNKSFVVITGPSGIGKSTIVKLVALQLQRTNGYQILLVTSPKDIVYFDPNIKQIYIIDDICGKFSVDQSKIDLWENVNRRILEYSKDNKDFRVLGTCRLEISISSPFRKLRKIYGITECNLLQEKFVYSKEEKLKIAACHIDEEIIKQLDDKILNAYNMFPLLCMMYASSESNPGVRFFEYPLEAIEEQLDEMKEQNECHFIGLALIVVYNNKLHKLLLQNGDDKKFKDVFNKVFEELGLRNKPSKRSVLSGLQTQEGIYTKELESTITVIHDKIFDILSLYFGKRIPKAILTHGSGTFIAERFLFESVKDDLKIVLPSELEHSYFKRMVEEIENNRFYNVFKNVQVCNELYQGKFISFLSTLQSIIQKLHYNKWPLYLSAGNGCKLLVQFILNKKRTSGMCNKLDKDGNHQDMLMDKPESDMYACSTDTDNDESTPIFYDTDDDDDAEKHNAKIDAYRIQFENSPMLAACEGGYIDIVECLVEYGYNIDHSGRGLPAPLFSACQYGNKDVVDFLLKRNCKVDTINALGQIALHTACINGNKDLVTSLLKCNSNINLRDIFVHTPLYYACSNDRTDIVQILLDNNCDIHGAINVACLGGYKDIVEIFIKHNVDINQHGGQLDKTPIYYACLKGHTDIVQILLDNNCDIHGAIHGACEGGYKDIVEILIKHNVDINQCGGVLEITPIYYACHMGQTDIVQILLDNNCDIHGDAINVACKRGYKDIVEILIKHNVNINQRGVFFNKTPILFACHNGHTDIDKLLLDNNCDVLDHDGFSNALHYACVEGFVDIVDLLLRNKCNINHCQPLTNQSPLIVACHRNKEAVVKLLLSYEACDVNIIDNKNRNALHYACREGQADVVELLLKRHCSVNLNDKEMKTPLFVACEKARVDIVKMLINQDNCMMDVLDVEGNSLLHATCGKCVKPYQSYLFKTQDMLYSTKNGRIEIIGILLGKSCDVNVLNNEGQSVLHAACVYGDTEIVDILLRSNSNVNQCDKAKKTPLFIACKEGYTEIVDTLLRSNSNVNQCDKEKKTPLFIACEEEYIDIVTLLIESKCEIVNHSLNGQTVLHPVVKSLLDSNYVCTRSFSLNYDDVMNIKSGVYELNDAGQSALHVACKKNYPEVVKFLLQNKFDVNQRDKLMKTPLILAVEGGHTKVVTMLVENKCDIDISDKDGRTALDIAEENRVVDIKNILLNVMKKDTNAHDACTTCKKAKYF